MKRSEIESIDNIFTTNLKVRKNEKVLIITDDKTKDIKIISRKMTERGLSFSKHTTLVKYKPTGCHGTEPPAEAWTAAFGDDIVSELSESGLLDPIIEKTATDDDISRVSKIISKNRSEAVDAVIALPYFSTSHTRFRSFLNEICGTRYASMPLFDRTMLTGPMMVDWKKMASRTNSIARTMRRYENIEVTAPNGTIIRMSRKGRHIHCDTGLIDRRGMFSNLPAGEVFLAPLEGTAEGVIVLDWAPTRRLKSHVTVRVSGGMVKAIEGNEEYVGFLDEKMRERPDNRNIAELGLGTNDMASRPDNILESEKILGTVHIAFGDNSSFGGTVRTPFHQDFVIFNPTVILFNDEKKRKVLMKDGELLNDG